MAQPKKRVAVIYGSRSVEHDVSIITAQQVMAALDKNKYDVTPIYITRKGSWYTHPSLFTGSPTTDIQYHNKLIEVDYSDSAIALPPDPQIHGLLSPAITGLLGRTKVLPIDVAVPVVHGTYGEDGTLQGVLEMADIPYVGSGVVGSAVGMDKIMTKAVLQAHGIAAVAFTWFTRREWEQHPAAVLERVQREVGLPAFVKPANLGSSIGISKATNTEQLRDAIEVAQSYDSRILVERAVEQVMEINCAVMGNYEPFASVCEQPVSWNEFLNFDDKYLQSGDMSGMKGAQRRIPAPISDDLTRQIQTMAVTAFRAMGCFGLARVDFLVDQRDNTVYLNEFNTTPGSFSFYLWSASGLRPVEVMDRLLELALEAHAEKRKTTFVYKSSVLDSSVLALGSGKSGLKK
ncbi:MAG: D-alanine--D-alanine ligase [Chloroflexaceae bacterium]|nr:D-alanine--D-alanine ligase [Chloroflexaceae bacterium]NJO05018.1 D-alanine--D-alanine ligase [Chloroflexaceae bacterium]